MIRTIWLAIFCLTCLAALVAIRIGATPVTRADASRLETTTPADTQQATSTKADKLKVSYIEPAATTTATPVAIVPPDNAPKPAETTVKPAETTIKIVSRHWHDPLAPKASPNVDQSKSKPSKASTR
jgi:hypothetical protein